MSDQETWYMDHLNVPWDKFYMIEPHLGITDVTKEKLVICGKVYIWGENVDAFDIVQTI